MPRQGAKAVVAGDFDTSQRAVQAAAGVRAERQGRGVAAQVALARRESPHKGQQHLGLAKVLTAEMPHTLHALCTGRITEWRATILVRETACLTLENRITVDRALAGDPDALEDYGEGELIGAARKLAYQLEPASVVKRRRRAEADRRVTLRPAPDVMGQLSALLPVAQAVAVYAALKHEADKLKALGDPRSRGQIMADTLIARITGATHTAAGGSPVVPIAINLVISQACLLGEATTTRPGSTGYGPVPADLARTLVAQSLEAGIKTWLRRLFTRPGTGELIAMDSRSRLVPAALARFIGIRDQTCRTPWCDAPIRHRDHVSPPKKAGRPPMPTAKGPARPATTPNKHTAGKPDPDPDHATPWKPPPRPATATPSTAPPPVGASQLAS